MRGAPPPQHARPLLAVAVILALLLTACGQPRGGAEAAERWPVVVATTSILGDVTANVVGGAGQVETLMGPETDPHALEPSADQIHRVREADLVVANGLGLEEGMADALAAAERDGTPVLWIAEVVDPVPFERDRDHGHQGHGHGTLDPHVWLDPVRMDRAVEVIARRLAEIAPGIGGRVRANARAYRAELARLDHSIRRTLAVVPPERRRLVTNHDAFGYLARRYGLEVTGTIIAGGSTLGGTSGAELTRLARRLEASGTPAVFVETTSTGRLAAALRTELGGRLEVVDLYVGTLGDPDGPGGTYVGMMKTNARRIAAALSG